MDELNAPVMQPGVDSQVTPEQTQAENMVTMSQRQLNDLISAKYKAGIEKGAEKERIVSQPVANNMTGLSEEDVKRLFQDQLQQAQQIQAQQIAAHNLVSQFDAKLKAASEDFPELEAQLEEIGIHEMPEIVGMTASLPNTAEVLADLVENPQKISTIISAFKNGNPKLAMISLHKLSNSIEKNKRAKESIVTPSEPTEQIQPSISGGDDSMASYEALRNLKYTRG